MLVSVHFLVVILTLLTCSEALRSQRRVPKSPQPGRVAKRQTSRNAVLARSKRGPMQKRVSPAPFSVCPWNTGDPSTGRINAYYINTDFDRGSGVIIATSFTSASYLCTTQLDDTPGGVVAHFDNAYCAIYDSWAVSNVFYNRGANTIFPGINCNTAMGLYGYPAESDAYCCHMFG